MGNFPRVLALAVLARHAQGKTVIAAVGDSVTAGDHGLPPFANDDEGNYPFFLQGLLDDAYPGQFEVANLGLSGATASDGTNKPYRNSKYWPQLQELAFDLAIVTLGTNDAKLAFWESPDFGVEKFEADYGTLLNEIMLMRPNATILVGYPVPCPLGGLKCKGMWGSDTSIINEDLQRATNRVAERVGLIEDVDFFEALGGRSPSPELFHDSIHPNYNGYQVLGQAAFEAILPLVSPTASPTTATPTRRPTPAPTTPAPSTPVPSQTPTTTTPTLKPSLKPTAKPTVRPTAPSCARVELVDASDCPADLDLPPCSDALETGQLCLGDDACADASLTNCGRRRLLEDDGARKAVYRVVAPAPTARPTPGDGGGSKGGGGDDDDAGLIAGVVIAVVVALGLCAGGAWFYHNKREPTKPTAELPSWATEDSKQGDHPPPPPPTSPTPLLAFAAPPPQNDAPLPPLTSPKSYEERRAMTPSVRNAMMATPSARKSEDLIGLDRPSFAKMKSQNDGAAPPVALRSPAPPPPSPFWKRLFGGAEEPTEEESAEPRPSWSRMTPPSSTEEPSSPADIAGAAPLPESPHSPPLEDAILSVIDPPELRPRASRAPTPPPQRQGFGRGPSAAIIASPRNVVIEPVPRVARTTSSQEVDELFEETKTPPGAPPAAEGDEGTFKY